MKQHFRKCYVVYFMCSHHSSTKLIAAHILPVKHFNCNTQKLHLIINCDVKTSDIRTVNVLFLITVYKSYFSNKHKFLTYNTKDLHFSVFKVLLLFYVFFHLLVSTLCTSLPS